MRRFVGGSVLSVIVGATLVSAYFANGRHKCRPYTYCANLEVIACLGCSPTSLSTSFPFLNRSIAGMASIWYCVHVELAYDPAPRGLGRKLVHHRRDCPARTAPRCPGVDQDRLAPRAGEFGFQRSIGEGERMTRRRRRTCRSNRQFLPAVAANRLQPIGAALVHPVLRAAIGAGDDGHDRHLMRRGPRRERCFVSVRRSDNSFPGKPRAQRRRSGTPDRSPAHRHPGLRFARSALRPRLARARRYFVDSLWGW